jgi:hypothetical protein
MKQLTLKKQKDNFSTIISPCVKRRTVSPLLAKRDYLYSFDNNKTQVENIINLLDASNSPKQIDTDHLFKINNIIDLFSYFSDNTSIQKHNKLVVNIQSKIKLYERLKEKSDKPISLFSLKYSLIILDQIKFFSQPDIVIDSLGMFQIRWKPSNDNALIISALENGRADFIIFTPCENKKKRNIITGNIDCYYIANYVNQLKLDALK